MALYTELAKLQLPYLEAGVAETIVTTDRFLGLLPLKDVSPAFQLQYTQEATLYLGNSGSLIAMDGTSTPQSASYTSYVQDLSVAIASFDMPRALATNNTIATEVSKKGKVVARKMGDMIINGTTSTANQKFNGLRYTVSGSTTQDFAVAAVGSGSFSLTVLDQALQAVKVGQPNLIVTSNAGIRYFKNALRTTGTEADKLQMPNYGTPFLAYDGIPIVASDWIGNEENGGTSFYTLYVDEMDGVTLWSNYSQLINVSSISVANSVKDNYTVAAQFGMYIPTALAVSRIYGITS